MKCPFGDLGVVTRAVPVLGICADVLRGVTVLAPVEPWSLGYELTGRHLESPRGSQTDRSRPIARPSHRADSHTIAAVAPRFVHKSVHDIPAEVADRNLSVLCHEQLLRGHSASGSSRRRNSNGDDPTMVPTHVSPFLRVAAEL